MRRPAPPRTAEGRQYAAPEARPATASRTTADVDAALRMARCVALLDRLCNLSDDEWSRRLARRTRAVPAPEDARVAWTLRCDPWDLWLVRDHAQTLCANHPPARRAERIAAVVAALLPLLAGREHDARARGDLAPFADLA